MANRSGRVGAIVALLGLLMVAFAVMPVAAVTEHCPEGWTSKDETGDDGDLVLEAGTVFCVKGGTEATGILIADGETTLGEYLIAAGISGGESYFAVYPPIATPTPSPSPSVLTPPPSPPATPTPPATPPATPTPSPTPPDLTINVTTCPLGSETLPAGLSVIRIEHPLLAILLLNVRIDGIAVQPGDLREVLDGAEVTVTAGVHSVEVTNAVTDEVLYENEALDCPECSATEVTPPPAAPTEPVPLVPNTAMPLSGVVGVVGLAVLMLGGLLLFNSYSVSRRT